MSLTITTAQVRYRLRSLIEADVSDNLLNSPSYIPAADAWLRTVLGVSSSTATTGDADKDALLQAAKIAYVARIVFLDAPIERIKEGPFEHKGIDAVDKKNTVDLLDKEINRLLNLAGYTENKLMASMVVSRTGDDYNDLTGDDETNIDYSLAADDPDAPFRVFP